MGTEVDREHSVTRKMLRNSSFFVKFPAKTEQSGAATAVLDSILIKNIWVSFFGFFQYQIGFTYGTTGFMIIRRKWFKIVETNIILKDILVYTEFQK